MIRGPPVLTLTDTLVPYTTLFRSRSFDQSRIVSRTVFCGAAGFCISCSSVALQDDGKAPLGVRIELLGGALQELVTANLGRSGFAHNHAFETPLVENIQQHHTLL